MHILLSKRGLELAGKGRWLDLGYIRRKYISIEPRLTAVRQNLRKMQDIDEWWTWEMGRNGWRYKLFACSRQHLRLRGKVDDFTALQAMNTSLKSPLLSSILDCSLLLSQIVDEHGEIVVDKVAVAACKHIREQKMVISAVPIPPPFFNHQSLQTALCECLKLPRQQHHTLTSATTHTKTHRSWEEALKHKQIPTSIASSTLCEHQHERE
jgi:hypothetical protein